MRVAELGPYQGRLGSQAVVHLVGFLLVLVGCLEEGRILVAVLGLSILVGGRPATLKEVLAYEKEARLKRRASVVDPFPCPLVVRQAFQL